MNTSSQMTSEELIDQIKTKVKTIADRKKELEVENSRLKTQLGQYKEQISKAESEIVEIKDRLKIVKMAKTLDNVKEKNTDSKYKINQLVKEIDRCIAMLSS